MNGNVVQLRPDGANNRCECGDEWVVLRIVVDHDGKVVARTHEAECASCGLSRVLPTREVSPDDKPGPQAEAYLVLSEQERAKGFVRPLRRKYIHVGIGGHEIDPNNPARHGRTGTGCGAATTMSLPLCETYARDPKFYGVTYCTGCQMHRPVGEFVWDEDGEVVGS